MIKLIDMTFHMERQLEIKNVNQPQQVFFRKSFECSQSHPHMNSTLDILKKQTNKEQRNL